jgi:hypothetical protein
LAWPIWWEVDCDGFCFYASDAGPFFGCERIVDSAGELKYTFSLNHASTDKRFVDELFRKLEESIVAFFGFEVIGDELSFDSLEFQLVGNVGDCVFFGFEVERLCSASFAEPEFIVSS